MKIFLINITRFALIGIIPMIVLLSVYLVLDPFKVVKSYDTFNDTIPNGGVGPNRDYLSTTTYAKSYKKYNYDSYIFGNSCSILFQVSDWKKYLPQNSNCYHFDASGESLFAILKKMEYIDSKGSELKNVLLILDYRTLIQDKSGTGHLYIISPELVNYSNIIEFHWAYFEAFLSPMFFYAYIDFRISGKIKPYMKKNHLLDESPLNYDPVSNEIRFDYFEDLISKNEFYTPDRLSIFTERDTILQYSPIAIKENQKTILIGINEIFKKHKTNFKIIINPLYDQLKLNPDDLQYLNSLFGEDNVFDYSGINKYTKDYKNYYDAIHYRPLVTREILSEIYQ